MRLTVADGRLVVRRRDAASSRSRTGRSSAASRSARRGLRVRRGRLHDRDDRLPGDRHRPELRRADRLLHGADGRQLRRRAASAPSRPRRTRGRSLMREARGPAWTDWLHERGIVALDRDRHALARARTCATRGAMRAVAVAGRRTVGRGASRACRAQPRDGRPRARRRRLDAASPTSTARRAASRVAVVDYGCKRSILRRLAAAGAAVTVFPHDADADELAALRRRAALERPRRPRAARRARSRRSATLLGRCRCSASASATSCSRSPPAIETYKLPFGHRGANHPVLDRRADRVLVTSQNHGFAVEPSEGREATHVSLYDGTVEGLDFPDLRARSVQFHPEAGPGPHDAWPILESWVEEVSALPRRDDLRLDLPDRLRPDRDRPGLRVRLRGLPGAEGAARGRLPHDRRQLEPGDDHDRPRASPTARTSSRSTSTASPTCSSASGPTRCCRRSAARRRSTSRSSWPSRACSTSSASS